VFAGKSCLEELGVNRRLFAVLSVSLLVFAAVFLKDTFSDQSAALFSSLEPIRTMYEGAGEVEKVRLQFVVCAHLDETELGSGNIIVHKK
jgi:hypothetical protein